MNLAAVLKETDGAPISQVRAWPSGALLEAVVLIQREAHGSLISQQVPRGGKQQARTSRDCSVPRIPSSHAPQSRSVLTVVKVQTVPGKDDTESH